MAIVTTHEFLTEDTVNTTACNGNRHFRNCLSLSRITLSSWVLLFAALS